LPMKHQGQITSATTWSLMVVVSCDCMAVFPVQWIDQRPAFWPPST
jgi:hypothetical protein